MIEFRMPSLGADMDEGTLLEWRIAPGDRVHRGDIVAVVDTDKAEIEVESWQEGTVEQIVVPVGRKVPVGELLATFREDGAAVAEKEERPASSAAAENGERPAPSAAAEKVARPAPAATPAAVERPIPAARAEPPRTSSPAPAPARFRATPLARRLAAERGLDLAALAGTGPDGAITRDDVEAAATAPAATPTPMPMPTASAPASQSQSQPEPTSGMRRAIAAAMQRAKREIPHYYLETALDFGAARAWLEAANRERPIDARLLPPALLLRAVARALREVPELNGFWIDDRLEIAEAVHLGFAVSLRGGGGLLTPVVRDADAKSVDEIMRALRELVSRARAGRLRSSEVGGATCTVTSLGERGVDKVFGIIAPPQVAMVGFGAIAERPWVRDGWLAARPVLTATLSADHRASDGQRGARFLARVARLLEHPEE